MGKVKKNEKVYNYDAYFPKLFRELLEEKKVKQEEIARYVGVTRQSISLYKDGGSCPDMYTFQKIVEYFREEHDVNYSLDFWLGIEKFNNNTKLNQLDLSAKAIKTLIEYKNDKLLTYCLDNLIINKELLNKLCKYLVISNLDSIIFDNDCLRNYCEFHCAASFRKDEKAKNEFADIIELLPLVKGKFRKQLEVNSEELIFEHINNILMEREEELKKESEMYFEKGYPNNQPPEFLDSEDYKDIDKKYNEFIKKKKTCI